MSGRFTSDEGSGFISTIFETLIYESFALSKFLRAFQIHLPHDLDLYPCALSRFDQAEGQDRDYISLHQ